MTTDIIYFPFTYISPEDQAVLAAFFPRVRVLDLDRETALAEPWDQAFVPVRLTAERAAGLDQRFSAYMDWARLHKGNERNLKYLLQQTPYFKTETDPTSIQSQIRGHAPVENPGAKTVPDPGLFLKLAHALDRENHGIEAELAALDRERGALFAELKGESALSVSGPAKRPDPGEIQPGKRMEAWVALAGETGLFTEAITVLVTTSPAIAADLADQAEPVINGLDIRSIKVHEQGCGNKAKGFQNVSRLLDQIIAGSLPDTGETLTKDSGCCGLSGYMTLWSFPDGKLNRKLNFPGRQVAVCLVGLNS